MANNNHFELTLDTLAPSGSITRPNQYINANANLTIVKDDAVFMKVWFNNEAVGTKSDIGYTGGSWEPAATSKATAFREDGVYYYHMVLMDDVANESAVYNTAEIVFDATIPVASAVYMEDPDSHSRLIVNDLNNVKFGFSFEDVLSGVAYAFITGADIDSMTAEDGDPGWHVEEDGIGGYEGTFNFKSGTTPGTKTISVTVYDYAGNSSVAATGSIVLDTEIDKPTLVLLNQEETEVLPAYINYTGIKINLSSDDTDIVGYKIWEGNSEPGNFTPNTAGSALDVTVQRNLSNGDGLKTIHAKVIDNAGNIISADDQTVTLDQTNPVVSLSSNKSIISNISGYNTAVLTMSGTDALSGVAGYELKCGSTTISSGASVPASFNLTSANSMVEGSNTITLYVTDVAGNMNSANVAVILDTTAPSASINQLNEWYTAEFNITANYSDANDIAAIYAWTSMTADDTTVPQDAVVIQPTTSPQSISNASIDWNLQQNAANYMHIKVVDEVGNAGYGHRVFGFDNVEPTCCIEFTADAYASVSAAVNVTYNDATSGVVQMKVWGDITAAATEQTASWENIASSKSVTLTSGDGYKTIHIKVKDAAGNVSDTVVSCMSDTCELDTTTPVPAIKLYEADGITVKPAVSPLATFSAHIYVTDDALGSVQYKLYGDFTYDAQAAQGITEQAAEWEDFVLDSGHNYMTIYDMYCTSGDGVKKAYVKIKDNAGNISDAENDFFTYDTSEPVVVVSNIDYNRLSKVHVLRRNASGEILEKYADQSNFTFTPNEAIQAYKVCAYEDQTAAAAGSHNDNPIPSTNGSVNMSATGLNSDAAVNAMIKGADYEIALGGASDIHAHDGTHIVVVYVQDLGGTWSVAAEFEVNS